MKEEAMLSKIKTLMEKQESERSVDLDQLKVSDPKAEK